MPGRLRVVRRLKKVPEGTCAVGCNGIAAVGSRLGVVSPSQTQSGNR